MPAKLRFSRQEEVELLNQATGAVANARHSTHVESGDYSMGSNQVAMVIKVGQDRGICYNHILTPARRCDNNRLSWQSSAGLSHTHLEQSHEIW